MRRRSPSEVRLITRSVAAPELVRAVLPCEIRVVDEEKREIELCATSEALDAHGTIFDYAASKRAFEHWAGNVREMHERKAVGRKVALRFDDDARKVYARLRISAGAQDTWEKVKDGTLAGASIGASNVTWNTQRRAGMNVPVATQYDLVELSLVDLPSNPDAAEVTFVRDGVPDAALLSPLDDARNEAAPGTDAAPTTVQAGVSATVNASVIREGSGSLSLEDPAAAIASAALQHGQNTLAGHAKKSGGNVAAAHSQPELTANERRLGNLGAPTYARRLYGIPGESTEALTVTRAGASADTSQDTATGGPGATYDVDGDHDGAGSADGSDGLEHDDQLHAHASHDHPHSGVYDDRHMHDGAHLHLDGTSHVHPHGHDHEHHDHSDVSRVQAGRLERVRAGHSHSHSHAHEHGHYYRVADGAPLDATLVMGEHLRTREYVSATAFRIAGGVEGHALSADQYRVAAGVEMRLELAAAERAQGAFSRNPIGAADIGTPAQAAGAPIAGAIAATELGAVRPLDRDGQPTAPTTGSSTGTLDVSTPADGYAQLVDHGGVNDDDDGDPAELRLAAAVTSSITTSVTAEVARIASAMTASFSALEERLARIEAQPQTGGPILRAADKSTPLTPNGSQSTAAQRIEALEGLAGRLRDPQAQVAVAAEMIRLQQEAAGMPPAMQVMPRAGRGWSE